MRALAPLTVGAARRAARRAFVAELVRQAGLWLMMGTAAGLLLIAAARLGLLTTPWYWLLVVPVVVSGAAAVLVAASRRWTLLHAASEIDRAYGLKDSLSSAIELSAGPPGAFSDWTVREAEAIAPGISVARVAPVRIDWKWGAWPILAAGAVALALFAPTYQWARPAMRPPVTLAQREEAANQIRQVQQAINRAAEAQEAPNASPEHLESLEELQRQLANGLGDPQEARARAARELEDLSQQMESRAEAEQAAVGEFKDQLASAATEAAASAEGEPAGSPLAQSLRQGDLDSAAAAAREAAEQWPSMTAEERQRLAEELEMLSELLDRPAPAPAGGSQSSPPPEAQSPAEDSTGDPGQPEPPEGSPPPKAAPSESPPAGTEAQRPPSPPSADPSETRRDLEELKRALKDSASELSKPKAGEQQEPPPGEPEEGTPRQAQPGQSGERPTPREQQGRGEPRQSPEGAAEQRPGQAPKPAEAPKPQPQPGDQPQPTPDGAKSAPPEGQPSQQQDSPQQPGEQDQQATEPQPDDQQEGEPGAVPQAQPGSGQEQQPSPSAGSGLRRVSEVLERLRQRQSDARQSQEQSQRLREMARKMLEDSTPEQREEMRRLAEQYARRGGRGDGGADEGPRGPAHENAATPEREFATDPVDVRRAPGAGEPRRERVIAEWYSDRPIEPGSGAAPAADALREAAQGAERALEQQAVPARYSDLVRGVYRRYSQQQPPRKD